MNVAPLRKWLEEFGILREVRDRVIPRQVDDVRILQSLPTFRPNSSGSIEVLARLTLQTAERTFPSLIELAGVSGRRPLAPVDVRSLCRSSEERQASARLKDLFANYGSDKTRHDYHYLYGHILSAPDRVTSVLEVGLGTNNTDTVSNMGAAGRPGASLRAFRDYLPHAEIVGADIDRRVLFQESGISTFFVDQTDMRTVEELGERLPNDMDLIIDDGLHSPDANIAMILLAVRKLRVGGWLVVEDISVASLPVWQIISFLMPGNFECSLVKASEGHLFAARRVS